MCRVSVFRHLSRNELISWEMREFWIISNFAEQDMQTFELDEESTGKKNGRNLFRPHELDHSGPCFLHCSALLVLNGSGLDVVVFKSPGTEPKANHEHLGNWPNKSQDSVVFPWLGS